MKGFVDSHGHAWMIGFQALAASLLPPPGKGEDYAGYPAISDKQTM
ncbi:hypothetical protein [Marinobacter arenosus]|nr:hypothetical protein [Marinobacter arenosus]MBW0149020.1 hypothetical protein [Marinobacter arenosus]